MNARSRSARCGHVKRRLRRNVRLTDELLELALETIGADNRRTGDALRDGIASKLVAGEQLDEYELHLMVDVYLDLP